MNTDEIFKKNEQQPSSSIHMSFTNRQKNLFDLLDKEELKVKGKLCPIEMPMETDEPVLTTNKRKRAETKHLRGKESIFKKPEEPLSKCLPLRSAPDHKRNPHKWVKYSLGDVRHEDMTEQSNTTAALSFLRELEERKRLTDNNEDEDESKIVFKKRTTTLQFNKSAILKPQLEETDDEKIAFRGSKIVMPEYIIGQKTKPAKKNKVSREKVDKSKEIKLDHLLEDEED